MDNIEKFNTVVGVVFADLYENFPVGIKLEVIEISVRAGIISNPAEAEYEEVQLADEAIDWLVDEGFIRRSGSTMSPSSSYGCVLTHKGLQLLSLPDSLKDASARSMGSKLTTAVKEGALSGVSDLAKTLICEGAKMAVQWGVQGMLNP